MGPAFEHRGSIVATLRSSPISRSSDFLTGNLLISFLFVIRHLSVRLFSGCDPLSRFNRFVPVWA